MSTEKRKKEMRTYYQTHRAERLAYAAEYAKNHRRSTTPIRRESRAMWQREKKVRAVNAHMLQHIPAGKRFVQLFDKIIAGEVRLTV